MSAPVRERGASLLEILVVVSVLSAVAAAGAIDAGGGDARTADAAARAIRRDLAFARELAVRTGAPVSVHFGVDVYTLQTPEGGALPEDAYPGADRLALRAETGGASAFIASASFAGSAQAERVVFAPDGAPLGGGAVLVRAGAASRTVRVAPVTGRIRVEGP